MEMEISSHEAKKLKMFGWIFRKNFDNMSWNYWTTNKTFTINSSWNDQTKRHGLIKRWPRWVKGNKIGLYIANKTYESKTFTLSTKNKSRLAVVNRELAWHFVHSNEFNLLIKFINNYTHLRLNMCRNWSLDIFTISLKIIWWFWIELASLSNLKGITLMSLVFTNKLKLTTHYDHDK